MYISEGNPETAEVVFVGEAPAKREIELGRPFAGLSGHVFDECLANAGILRSRSYITNVFDILIFKDKRTGNIYDKQGGEILWKTRGGFTAAAAPYRERLADELRGTTANVICPLGGPAIGAICDKPFITKWRGSILYSTIEGLEHRKCIPSIHPANALHGSGLNKHIITYDFERIRREKQFPEIRRPQYKLVNNPTFVECVNFLRYLKHEKPFICVDIETPYAQVSRICFSLSKREAISIPYGDGDWTLEQECQLWRDTADVLEDKAIPKLWQGGIFDTWFLYYVHGILCQGPFDDTLIAHSIMYPEFPKSLGFLSSIYTDQPYHKGMVKQGAVSKEDG